MVYYLRGVPVRSAGSLYGKGTTPTVLIRINKDLKNTLDQLKRELKRDTWRYISYSDIIEYLIKKKIE